jgi:hypothetical protein
MEGRRRRGRPRKRWLHDLEEDLRVMQVGRWWEKVRSKEEWRRIVRGPRPTPGCNAEEFNTLLTTLLTEFNLLQAAK